MENLCCIKSLENNSLLNEIRYKLMEAVFASVAEAQSLNDGITTVVYTESSAKTTISYPDNSRRIVLESRQNDLSLEMFYEQKVGEKTISVAISLEDDNLMIIRQPGTKGRSAYVISLVHDRTAGTFSILLSKKFGNKLHRLKYSAQVGDDKTIKFSPPLEEIPIDPTQLHSKDSDKKEIFFELDHNKTDLPQEINFNDLLKLIKNPHKDISEIL